MATIVNNPPPSNNSGGPLGVILALVVLIVLISLVFVFGLPALRYIHFSNPQINIPSKIDVNVHQSK